MDRNPLAQIDLEILRPWADLHIAALDTLPIAVGHLAQLVQRGQGVASGNRLAHRDGSDARALGLIIGPNRNDRNRRLERPGSTWRLIPKPASTASRERRRFRELDGVALGW
jgi:hypothetical protein